MKIMSRNFTKAEKILIILLAVILVALIYYRLVDTNVRQSMSSSAAELESLRTETDIVTARLINLKRMQSEIDTLNESGGASRMESYNNSKAEVAFLNDVLSDAEDYSVSFSDVTRSGNQIRRAFTLNYRTDDYDSAEKILERLSECEYRCLLGDVTCTMDKEGRTTINAVATFYETMVGGTPDSGLPNDTAATN